MKYSISDESNSKNESNPNRIVGPQFLLSFGSLQLADDGIFQQFGVSESPSHRPPTELISSLSTLNHGGDQDSMKIMNQCLENSVSDDPNIWAFDHDHYQRSSGFLVSNTPQFDSATQYIKNSDLQSYFASGSSSMNVYGPSFQPMGFHKFENYQSNQMERLLSEVHGSVSWLMVNQTVLFQEVVDLCEDKRHLNLLVTEAFSNSKLLIDAMFTKQGSISVAKLIKRLKYTPHAFTLTRILATRFYDMATHPIAKNVIQKCFYVFGSGPNEALYEQLIYCHRDLAIHQMGCRTLKECIDAISGNYRNILLHYIANFSDCLSNDPYGNYVVQHVLELRNNEVNEKILARLKGQFVSLAQKKGGSHVVEKCMEVSEGGVVIVVKEILQSPNSLCLVAKDLIGNYIIQKALDMTKKWGHVELYKYLVENLTRQTAELERTPGGKHVINFLKHGKLIAIYNISC